MSEPYMSEIRIMPFGFAPKGWAPCNGQLLPINQNQALFALLGTSFGGDGRTNFALPDLRARTPIHFHGAFQIGQRGGEQSHTLSISEMPTHPHVAQGTPSNADTPLPAGNYLGAANNTYTPAANVTTLHPSTITNAGGSQPHMNMQPYLTLNFCIALQGIFPSPN